jgi:carboxypeptidase T
MRSLLLLLATLFIFHTGFAQKPQLYSRAKIYLDESGHTFTDLAKLGIAVDHGDYKKNTYFISDFSASEISMVEKAGYKVDIIIKDVSQHYRDQNKKKEAAKTTAVSCAEPVVPVPSHFHLGSYGGYFTYTELLNILDSMQLLYPGLISVKQNIGTYQTIEGRPIYWVRMSNNPSVDQITKPQMLYTALHHAREPGSISQLIFYMWHMLENYSTDPQIKTIIDNTELYFVPCVNPDGYIYNITTSPGGGGMWRKNRRDNLDGEFGVDLNRNYASGSSPSTSSDTYRGTAGFSEPETQAIKWFCDNHLFKMCLNYHTYQNDVLYPWNYVPSALTVDSNTFFNVGAFLTQHNHYRFGTCYEVLSYVSNGASDDWMYGDVSTKPKIFAMTPEVGTRLNGFYPPATSVIPDAQANLLANINAASLLLPFGKMESSDKKILTQSSGYLHYNFQRLGFPNIATYTVSIIPLDSWLTTSTTPNVYVNPTPLQVISDSFSYTLSATTPNNQLVSYVLKVDNGSYSTYDTVHFYYGKYNALSEPSTSSLTGWTNAGWGISTAQYHTAPSCFQSSLSGNSNYPNNADLTISTTSPVDLTNSLKAYLYFHGKWNIEAGDDLVYVNASTASSGWQPLCGKFTRPDEMTDLPIYDGMQNQWVREEIDLSDYLGQQVNLQFELVSDPGINYKGFYLDDVSVITVENGPVKANAMAANSSLNVYPNPAGDVLNISLKNHSFNQPLQAAMYDCLGRQVMNFTISSNTSTLDVSPVPAGLYYLKISEGGRVLPVQKVNIAR